MHCACPAPPAPDLRPAIVISSTFLGPIVHVEAQLESGETCTAQIPANGGNPFRPGDAVHLCWNPSDELRFEA